MQWLWVAGGSNVQETKAEYCYPTVEDLWNSGKYLEIYGIEIAGHVCTDLLVCGCIYDSQQCYLCCQRFLIGYGWQSLGSNSLLPVSHDFDAASVRFGNVLQ
jgi:hypothetical protein